MQEIIEMDEQIEQEIKDGIIPDPNAVDPITGEPLEGGGDLGDVPQDPERRTLMVVLLMHRCK